MRKERLTNFTKGKRMKNLKVNAFGDVVERGLYDYGNHKAQLSFNFEKKYEVVMHQINIQKMGEFKLKMNELQNELVMELMN